MAATVHPVFMAFGDSITQGAWEAGFDGFGLRLAHVYARKLDVLNRGYSGYNTVWAKPIFQQAVAKKHEREGLPTIRVLTIWFGANDACVPSTPQHVPLPEFISNLKEFISMIRSPQSDWYSPETSVILISPPPVNTYQRLADLCSRDPPRDLDRDFETTRKYANAVIEVGKEMGVPVVDVWNLLWEGAGKQEENLSKYLYDGLHVNKEGYTVMYDALMHTIRKHFPELHPDNMPYIFPPWLQNIPPEQRF